MKSSLRKIIVKSTIAAVLSVAGSLGLAITVVPLLGGVVDGNAWLMCIVIPLTIAFPATAFQCWQQQRLEAANHEIKRLHGELSIAHAALVERARRDGMTGMLNRESFFAELKCSLAATAKGMLLVIDADHFKQINDRFGHPIGDEALRLIAQAIAGALRDGDLAGRIGGEEFAVFLSAVEGAAAEEMAEQVRRAVEQVRFETAEGDAIVLTVSIGGALHQGGLTLSELFGEADRQLYKAKHLGRNCVVFASDLAAAA